MPGTRTRARQHHRADPDHHGECQPPRAHRRATPSATPKDRPGLPAAACGGRGTSNACVRHEDRQQCCKHTPSTRKEQRRAEEQTESRASTDSLSFRPAGHDEATTQRLLGPQLPPLGLAPSRTHWPAPKTVPVFRMLRAQPALGTSSSLRPRSTRTRGLQNRRPDQGLRLHADGIGQSKQRLDSHVDVAALDPLHEADVEARDLAQSLLSQPQPHPSSADIGCNRLELPPERCAVHVGTGTAPSSS